MTGSAICVRGRLLLASSVRSRADRAGKCRTRHLSGGDGVLGRGHAFSASRTDPLLDGRKQFSGSSGQLTACVPGQQQRYVSAFFLALADADHGAMTWPLCMCKQGLMEIGSTAMRLMLISAAI